MDASEIAANAFKNLKQAKRLKKEDERIAKEQKRSNLIMISLASLGVVASMIAVVLRFLTL